MRIGARPAFVGLSLLVVAATALALLTGPFPLGAGEIAAAVGRAVTGQPAADDTIDTVLFSVRLPRVAAALLVGAALSAAGTVY